MTVAVQTKRDVLLAIVNRIVAKFSGEVFAEDVNEVMESLGLLDVLYSKVSTTLEEVISNLHVVWAFNHNPKWAWAHFFRGQPYPGKAYIDSLKVQYEAEANRGINLIVGLAALSQ